MFYIKQLLSYSCNTLKVQKKFGGATLCSIWDLKSLNRDQILASCDESVESQPLESPGKAQEC